jgi:hypothetical protein
MFSPFLCLNRVIREKNKENKGQEKEKEKRETKGRRQYQALTDFHSIPTSALNTRDALC